MNKPSSPADVFAPRRHDLSPDRLRELAGACGFEYFAVGDEVFRSSPGGGVEVVGGWAELFPAGGRPSGHTVSLAAGLFGLGKMTAEERHVWRAAYAAALASLGIFDALPLRQAYDAVRSLRTLFGAMAGVPAELRGAALQVRPELLDAALEAMQADAPT